MPQNVDKLRDREAGKDIYIVGSGKSIDYIPDTFWQDKVIIGVNSVPTRIPCTYCISHHYFVLQQYIDRGDITVVTSEAEMGILFTTAEGWVKPTWWHEVLKGEIYVYKHLNQQFTRIDLSVFDTIGYLITGGSIVTTALHLGYLLGGKNLILSGVDGGTLDGEINYTGYFPPTPNAHPSNTQHQLERMANSIRERGIPVMSINPFINYTNEDHVFECNESLIPRG